MKKKQDGSRIITKKYTLYFNIAIVGAILCGILAAYFINRSVTVNKWSDKIYPGVLVDGIDLSGKTKEEAKEIIENQFTSEILDKKIIVDINGMKKEYSYGDIDATYNVDEVIESALNYGKDLSVGKKYKIIKSKSNQDVESGLRYNNDKLVELENKLRAETTVEAKDATISINYGEISITPEEIGYEVDVEKLHNDLISNLNGQVGKNTEITAELKEIEPKVTKDMLSKISSTPMSTFSTSYGNSSYERSENLRIVTSLINGTVLMPGEEFSYSGVSQKGRGEYLNAGVYINNKLEQAEAGGICQASSTLYNAVMRANIRSVERTNHSLTVSYVPLGLDATVAWGYLDYKFKNTYDFPIYIEGITNNRVVTFNIYGDPNALNGIKYELISNVLETIPPEISYQDDNTLEVGKEITESVGQTGYKVESYLVGYKDGVEVSREFLSKDTYANTKTVIRRGTLVAPITQETTDEEASKEQVKEENNNENVNTEVNEPQ